MKRFQPELGQAAFGQRPQFLECPDYLINALSVLEAMWEVFDPENNPFRNNGAKHKGKTFEVEAYSWSDEDQPYNFKWRDIKINWYKYFARSISVNREVTLAEAKNLCVTCVAELREYFINKEEADIP
jgi:hypothetical protein